jgi:hypothetical protein
VSDTGGGGGGENDPLPIDTTEAGDIASVDKAADGTVTVTFENGSKKSTKGPVTITYPADKFTLPATVDAGKTVTVTGDGKLFAVEAGGTVDIARTASDGTRTTFKATVTYPVVEGKQTTVLTFTAPTANGAYTLALAPVSGTNANPYISGSLGTFTVTGGNDDDSDSGGGCDAGFTGGLGLILGAMALAVRKSGKK